MEQEAVSKKEMVNSFLDKGLLLSSDVINQISNQDLEKLHELLLKKKQGNLLVINKEVGQLITSLKIQDINWMEMDKIKTLSEKGKNKESYLNFVKHLLTEEEIPKAKEESKIKIINSYVEESKKRDIQDFVQYFNNRYETIKKILKNRSELTNTLSINRIKAKKDRDHSP